VSPARDVERITPDRLDRALSDPLAARLFPTLARGVTWELERTRRALGALGDPHLAYPALHVGGTNGKGSVASTLHSVMRTGGRRVGLYTSPHLCSFCERYIVDGRPVAEPILLEAGRRVRRAVEAHGLTFFEAATVLAFDLFADLGAEVVVAEVGLGGRLDATNVLTPLVAAITNVALDHAEYLGRDLVTIAREKAGIIKAGVPVVVSEEDPELVAVFREVAVERGAPFHRVDPVRDVEELEVTRVHTEFTLRTDRWGRLRLRTPLVGRHQAVNASLAVKMLEHLPEGLRPDGATVALGVGSVRWPGRAQLETVEGRTWLLDVAHNTAGIGSLVDTLGRLDPPRPWITLLGVLGDKDWRGMLPPLLASSDAAWLTLPELGPPERRWDPAAVAKELASGSGAPACPLRVDLDFGEALRGAREEAGDGTLVVTGSVYTVGSALTRLGLDPFGAG
jgi:dihydrofolate synthase/folylpolyglutamate synthase